MLALHHPDIFRIVADLARPINKLRHLTAGYLSPMSEYVTESCPCDVGVCEASCGQLKFTVDRAVAQKAEMYLAMKEYELSYECKQYHKQRYLPANDAWGVYHSPVLMLHMADTYGEQDLQPHQTSETYKTTFAYSVYAYQYDLWVWPCMSITRVPRLLFVDWVGNLAFSLEQIRQCSDYMIEYHVVVFLHRWFHYEHSVHEKSDKPVIESWKRYCRHHHKHPLPSS